MTMLLNRELLSWQNRRCSKYKEPSLNTMIKLAKLRSNTTNKKQGTATDEERLIDDAGERKGPGSKPIDERLF